MQLKGEVYFLRAYYYALLMSFHGGVPLIDRPYELDEDYQLPRNTLSETVDFIIKDLDTAIDILPLSGDKARATKGAAMALKARVLLYAASDLFNSKASALSYADSNKPGPKALYTLKIAPLILYDISFSVIYQYNINVCVICPHPQDVICTKGESHLRISA